MTSLSSLPGVSYAGSHSGTGGLLSAIERVDGVDSGSAAAEVGTGLLTGGGSLSAGEGAILSKLSDGEYRSDNMGDFDAVIAGSDVTPQFDGGYNVLAIYSDYGSVQFYGGTVEGSAANGLPSGSVNAKAAVVNYAPGDSAAERQSQVPMALGYLGGHASDSQSAGGQWSGPTFDVQA